MPGSNKVHPSTCINLLSKLRKINIANIRKIYLFYLNLCISHFKRITIKGSVLCRETAKYVRVGWSQTHKCAHHSQNTHKNVHFDAGEKLRICFCISTHIIFQQEQEHRSRWMNKSKNFRKIDLLKKYLTNKQAYLCW